MSCKPSLYLLAIVVAVTVIVRRVESYSNAEFCLFGNFEENRETSSDKNRLQSVFTIKDKVYLRTGFEESRLFVYDIYDQVIQKEPIRARRLFDNHFPIVEFAAAVDCGDQPKCREKAQDLVIAIGRQSLSDYYSFATFKVKEDGTTLTKLPESEVPFGWWLSSGEEVFRFGIRDTFQLFFPDDMINQETNSSNIVSFAFIPSHKFFVLMYSTGRTVTTDNIVFCRKTVNEKGDVWREWDPIKFRDEPMILRSIFSVENNTYAISTDLQLDYPRVVYQIFFEEDQGVDFVKTEFINMEARRFFFCYDGPPLSPLPKIERPPPTTRSTTTPSTSTTSTQLPETEPTKEETEPTKEETEPTKETSEVPIIDSTISTSGVTTEMETHEPSVPLTSGETSAPITTQSFEDTSQSTFPPNVEVIPSESTTRTNALETTPTPRPKDNHLIFWIIFLLLLFLVLLAIIGGLFYLFYNKRRKGDQYATGPDGKPKIIIARSPTSARAKAGLDQESSPSLRSKHEPNEDLEGQAPLPDDTPTAQSMRSLNEKADRTDLNKAETEQPSTTSMRTLNAESKQSIGKSPTSETQNSMASLRTLKDN